MNKTASIIISLAIVASIGIIFIGGSRAKNNKGSEPADSIQNIKIRDGVQYVTINARGGYFPRLSSAKAGIPTKLIVKTNGTYDCSTSLVIRSLDYQKILPQTGETEIDIGTPKAGVPLQGLCSMGMYNFVVKFD